MSEEKWIIVKTIIALVAKSNTHKRTVTSCHGTPCVDKPTRCNTSYE